MPFKKKEKNGWQPDKPVKARVTVKNVKRDVSPVDTYDADSPDIETLIKNQHAEYERAMNDREKWQTNQLKWYKRRYGIRPAMATFPWLGASNLHLPLIDKTIRKLKPEYVSVIYNVTPMCALEPKSGDNLEQAEMASWHFDWLLRSRMKILADTIITADKTQQKGFCLHRVTYVKSYEPKTIKLNRIEVEKQMEKELQDPTQIDILTNPAKVDQLYQAMGILWGMDREDEGDLKQMEAIAQKLWSGADEVEFTIDETVYNAPVIKAVDPEDVIVPGDTRSEFDLEAAQWIQYRYEITPMQLLKFGKTGKFKMSVVKKILELKGIKLDDLDGTAYNPNNRTKDNRANTQKNFREGISGASTNNGIVIFEVCKWHDSDGDGREERHVLEYAEDYQVEALRFIRYPYSMNLWPWVKVPNELTDDRHYSPRGQAEILNPLQMSLNVQQNQKINRQTLGSTPMLMYDPSKVNSQNFRFVPGQGIPVSAPVNQNAQWLSMPFNDMSFDNEENRLKGWAEEYTGSSDFGISSATTGNSSRTATEVAHVQNSRVGVRQLDIQIFQGAYAETFKRVWALWMEFGPDEINSPVDSTGKVTRINKKSLFGDFSYTPNGRFGTTDPVLEAQKALNRLQLFNNDPMINQYELRREYIAKDDPRLVNRLLQPKQTAGELAIANRMQGGGAPGGPAGPGVQPTGQAMPFLGGQQAVAQ